MERRAGISALALQGAMQQKFKQLMEQVAEAVNGAPAGRIIVDSEEQVRDLLGEFRQETFQTALQLTVDAAEAAFPPGGSNNGEAQRK